jgi:hypothetical protein
MLAFAIAVGPDHEEVGVPGLLLEVAVDLF